MKMMHKPWPPIEANLLKWKDLMGADAAEGKQLEEIKQSFEKNKPVSVMTNGTNRFDHGSTNSRTWRN